MLYIRMFFTMIVSLYTSRIILETLGVEDYGIYNAVGGFVAMFAIISNSLSAAISRFITYELGKGTQERINKIFSTAVLIQIIISFGIILLAITLGFWFINSKMVIPEDRLNAANWVFYLSVLTFVVNLISVPYNACIIAHEQMKAFAYIGIIEAVLRLGIAFAIIISPIDALVFYALLMCLLAVLIRSLYGTYCKRHFEECHFRWVYDKVLVKEIFGFAGWNFIGASSGVLKDQGVNVLLNIFCGPAVNAARAIAMQVSSAVTLFSTNFMTALNPQITKSYAANEKEYVFSLVCKGARFSFLLLFVLSLPILVETDTILTLWLKVVPDFLVPFTRLVLLSALIGSLSQGMITLMLATGDIRKYQLVVGGVVLLDFPLSYIALKLGFSPSSVFVIAAFIAFCCLFLRLKMLKDMVGFPVGLFVSSVLIRVLIVSLVSMIIPLLLTYFMPTTIFRMLLNGCLCVLVSMASIFVIGCTPLERKMVTSKMKNIFKRSK